MRQVTPISTIRIMTSKGRFNRKALANIPAVTPIGSVEPVSISLPKAVERIARTLNPVKIILFGSYAYGVPTPDSDVDLLVVMNSQERDARIFLSYLHSLNIATGSNLP